MVTTLAFVSEFWQEHIVKDGQRAEFLLLLAFFASFLFIRTSARLMRSPKVPWWPGSVETSGGLHIHHLVWGICLLLICGFIAFATQPSSPWHDLLAIGFGIGAGLTIDEFALWLHLDDVYWSEEGRASVDAFILAAILAGMAYIGFLPFDVDPHEEGIGWVAATIALNLALVAICFFKGKLFIGAIGAFIPLVALIGAIRLASPRSPWARRRYADNPAKMERAEKRWVKVDARKTKLLDLLGGTPDPNHPREAARRVEAPASTE